MPLPAARRHRRPPIGFPLLDGRYTLAAGLCAVVLGVGFTVVGISKQAGAEPSLPSSAQQPLTAASPSGSAGPARDVLDTILAGPASPTPSTSASPTATASATPTSSPTSAKRRAATSKPRDTPTKTTAPDNPPASSGGVVDEVLAHINAARDAEGLPALRLDGDLSRAAALHNEKMIAGCGLQHQCSGESELGARFSAQGVNWSSAGENIGYGTSGSSDSALIKLANNITDSMLAEVPPNDGHRKNLLNAGFRRIGLSVVHDNQGNTWMTQDFVN